jgi:hypothetical protein
VCWSWKTRNGDGREPYASSTATCKWKRQLSCSRESLIGPVRTPDPHRGCRIQAIVHSGAASSSTCVTRLRRWPSAFDGGGGCALMVSRLSAMEGVSLPARTQSVDGIADWRAGELIPAAARPKANAVLGDVAGCPGAAGAYHVDPFKAALRRSRRGL